MNVLSIIVGHIEGCMDKPTEIHIDPSSLEYAPTAGIKPLREAVATLYNDLYRKGKESQYTWENVSLTLHYVGCQRCRSY
jgi:hypothetical protein